MCWASYFLRSSRASFSS